jgi:hypothetical protein
MAAMPDRAELVRRALAAESEVAMLTAILREIHEVAYSDPAQVRILSAPYAENG